MPKRCNEKQKDQWMVIILMVAKKAGKEVLIKATDLAFPKYVRLRFLLPLKICEKLASATAS